MVGITIKRDTYNFIYQIEHCYEKSNSRIGRSLLVIARVTWWSICHVPILPDKTPSGLDSKYKVYGNILILHACQTLPLSKSFNGTFRLGAYVIIVRPRKAY